MLWSGSDRYRLRLNAHLRQLRLELVDGLLLLLDHVVFDRNFLFQFAVDGYLIVVRLDLGPLCRLSVVALLCQSCLRLRICCILRVHFLIVVNDDQRCRRSANTQQNVPRARCTVRKDLGCWRQRHQQGRDY
jgi:hypothetical protein